MGAAVVAALLVGCSGDDGTPTLQPAEPTAATFWVVAVWPGSSPFPERERFVRAFLSACTSICSRRRQSPCPWLGGEGVMKMALPVRQRTNEPARWSPFSEFQRAFPQLGELFQGWGELPSVFEDGFTPLADIEETDDAYVVELELPGVKKEDVEIAVAGRRLTISGERKEKERVGVLRRRTRSVGRFHFEVTLPEDVDASGVSAAIDHGVLTVRVPKAAADRPRRIEVK
jgi:HSP20 family protein